MTIMLKLSIAKLTMKFKALEYLYYVDECWCLHTKNLYGYMAIAIQNRMTQTV